MTSWDVVCPVGNAEGRRALWLVNRGVRVRGYRGFAERLFADIEGWGEGLTGSGFRRGCGWICR